jgi:hypothetical protein
MRGLQDNHSSRSCEKGFTEVVDKKRASQLAIEYQSDTTEKTHLVVVGAERVAEAEGTALRRSGGVWLACCSSGFG